MKMKASERARPMISAPTLLGDAALGREVAGVLPRAAAAQAGDAPLTYRWPALLCLLEALLLQDPHPQVRCQALAALGQLAAALEPEREGFAPLLRLLLAATADASEDVRRQLLHGALPAVLAQLAGSPLLITELLRQVSGQARQVSVPRPDDTLAALTAAAAGR